VSNLDFKENSRDMTSGEIETISALLTLATNARGRLSATLKGNTVNNILGTDGNCASATPFTATDCALTIETGTLKITLSADSGTADLPVLTKMSTGKYWLIQAKIKNSDATNIALSFYSDDQVVSATAVTENAYTVVGILIAPTDYNTATVANIRLTATGSNGKIVYADNIMQNEITSTQYGTGTNTEAEALLAKYPYHDDVKSSSPCTVSSINGINTTTATIPVETKSVGTVKDTYNVNTGLYTKNISEWVALSGNAFTWAFNTASDYTGYKRVGVATSNFTNALTSSSTQKIIKYNNKELVPDPAYAYLGADKHFLSTNWLNITIADVDSGWAEGWTDATSFTGLTWAGLIKAYMNGWKLTTANVNVASCVWTGITSGTVKNAGAADYAHVQANIDVGFTPYQMIYQLATAVPTTYPAQILQAFSGGTVTITPDVAGESTIPTIAYSTDANLSARISSLETEIYALDQKVSTRTTWAPTVVWGTADPTGSVAQVARYHKIGNMVFVNYSYTATDGNDASSLTITLPFTPKDSSSLVALSAQQKVDTTWTNPLAYIDDDSGGIAFRALSTCTNAAAVEVIVSGCYEIA